MQEHVTRRARPRRSRQLRSKHGKPLRRRRILRTLARAGAITPPSHVMRGSTVWLHSPEMARAKGDIDGV